MNTSDPDLTVPLEILSPALPIVPEIIELCPGPISSCENHCWAYDKYVPLEISDNPPFSEPLSAASAAPVPPKAPACKKSGRRPTKAEKRAVKKSSSTVISLSSVLMAELGFALVGTKRTMEDVRTKAVPRKAKLL